MTAFGPERTFNSCKFNGGFAPPTWTFNASISVPESRHSLEAQQIHRRAECVNSLRSAQKFALRTNPQSRFGLLTTAPETDLVLATVKSL